MDRLMHDLKKLVLCDIETVVKRGEIAPGDYDGLGQAVDIIKDIETIAAMDEYGAQPEEVRLTPGMSGRMPMRIYDSYDRGWDGNGRSYGNSYERGRSPETGRYVSRDDETMAKLNNMMATAKTDQERDIIRRMMDELGR